MGNTGSASNTTTTTNSRDHQHSSSSSSSVISHNGHHTSASPINDDIQSENKKSKQHLVEVLNVNSVTATPFNDLSVPISSSSSSSSTSQSTSLSTSKSLSFIDSSSKNIKCSESNIVPFTSGHVTNCKSSSVCAITSQLSLSSSASSSLSSTAVIFTAPNAVVMGDTVKQSNVEQDHHDSINIDLVKMPANECYHHVPVIASTPGYNQQQQQQQQQKVSVSSTGRVVDNETIGAECSKSPEMSPSVTVNHSECINNKNSNNDVDYDDDTLIKSASHARQQHLTSGGNTNSSETQLMCTPDESKSTMGNSHVNTNTNTNSTTTTSSNTNNIMATTTATATTTVTTNTIKDRESPFSSESGIDMEEPDENATKVSRPLNNRSKL
ncbi:hypothetical protein BLOT_005869 [Blomia tropicalis]|nr:hypothetical protein BLOT_005869 [Blomia tropicalis]